MTFQKFRTMCRCSFEDALDMVRTSSGKTHIFLTVDELTNIPSEASVGKGPSLLQECLQSMIPLLDRAEGKRLNVVFSSHASHPLPTLTRYSGKAYRVRTSLQIHSLKFTSNFCSNSLWPNCHRLTSFFWM